MAEPRMQCAWCRCHYDEWGPVGPPLPLLDREASHGICVVCLCRVLRERWESVRQRGDAACAARVERDLLLVLSRFRRRGADVAAGVEERYRRALDHLEGAARPAEDRTGSGIGRAARQPGRPADRVG